MAASLAALVSLVFMAACGESAAGSGSPVVVTVTGSASGTATATATPSPTPTATPTPIPWPLTIVAVGDIMLARSVAGAVTEGDPAGPFAHTREVLAAADITLGNLECALSDGGAPEAKAYTFRGPPLAAEGLALAGFDAVALANNHALDYGPAALLDTFAALEANGVAWAGAGLDAQSAAKPVFLERRGLRVAVLSFVDVPSEAGYDMRAWEAAEGRPGVAWAEEAAVTAAVKAAASAAEIVVVMFHFGAEGSSTPAASQRTIARAAIDAGAELVIGSHAHVLQEVEAYGGGLIAYSLGNFVFDGFEGTANESAILRVSLGPGGIEDWELIPVEVGWDGLPRPVE